MFAMTCDFHENLWECLICWIWTVIKSNRKRLQLAQAHELNHISSTTCQSREHWETSRDWKSKQTLNCSVVFCVKFFADGDEDLEPDTWSPIGIWRASLITIVQQMPTVGTNTESGELRPSKWDNDNSMINLCWCCWLVKLKQFSGEISLSKCIISAKLDYHAAIKMWLCVCQW